MQSGYLNYSVNNQILIVINKAEANKVLREKVMDKKKNILFTGITGNIGALLARRLLEDDNVTIYALARSERVDVSRRIKRSLRTFGAVTEEMLASIVPIKIDITSKEELESLNLPEKIDETWHFASSLKYLAKDYMEICDVNIISLKNIIQLHKRVGNDNAKFYYVSTAYIGGKNFELVREEEIRYKDSMQFNNEYERSKLKAENLVMDEIRKGDFNANILRPSVATGEKETGKLINYHGYYLGIQALSEFKKYLVNKNIEERFFRITGKKDATINLIPIDDCVEIMLKIKESNPEKGEIFNVVNKNSVPMDQLLRVMGQNLGVHLECGDSESFQERKKTKEEKMMAYGTTYIMPYFDQKTKFDATNTSQVLGHIYEYKITDEKLFAINQKYLDDFR